MMFYGGRFKQNSKGFTLIEILLVVVLLVAISLFTFSFWKDFLRKNQLNSAATGIVNDLRDAQQRTVTEQVVYLIHFYSSSGEYDLIRINPTNGNRETVKAVTLSPDISMSSVTFPSYEVQFNAGGGVSAPGVVVLTKDTLNVTIDVKASGFSSFRF